MSLYVCEWPTAIMLFTPTSGVTEMFPEKLKCTGSGINLKSGIRLCGATSGTWSTSTKVLSGL